MTAEGSVRTQKTSQRRVFKECDKGNASVWTGQATALRTPRSHVTGMRLSLYSMVIKIVRKNMKTWGCVGKCLWEVGKVSWGGYDHDTLCVYICQK